DTNGQSVAFASALAASNSGGLTKSGSGTLTLAADNAYTGLTTVSGGTLQIGDGGTTGSIAGNLTLSNAATTVFNRSNALTYSGSLSGSNGTLMKVGGGALTLSGTSGMTGGTIAINGGSLITTNASSLATGTTFNTFAFAIDGGTLANAAGATSSGISGRVGSLAIGAGGATIRSDLRFDTSAVISGASPTASLTYGTASGTVSNVLMVISGNSTYAGGTKIESGIDMVVDNNNAFGTGTLELAGARLRSRAGPPRTLANALTISANTQFFGGASEPNLTFTNTTLLSGGTRTLQVDNVITGGTSAGQPGVIFTNVISDGGNSLGITKTGAGVLALAGANTYSGATTLSAGTIQLQNQAALQNSTLSLSGTGGVVFDSAVSGNAFTLGGLSASSNAATLALQNSAATAIALTVGGNNANTTYAGSLTGSGSLEKVGAGSLILSGPNTFAGTATVTSGTMQVGNGTTGGLAANIVNNAVLVFGRSNAATYSGDISGSGSVTTSGAGTLTLSGSNSYSGPTTVAGGTLALGSASALPSSGTVTFTGGALQYSSSYTTDLSSRIVDSSAAIVIDTNNQNAAFATALAASNVGGLSKLGSGTLTLSAANAFTGPVTVGGGVLAAGDASALPASGNVSFTGGTLQYSAAYTADLSSRIVDSTAAIAIDTNNQNAIWASSLPSTNVGGLTKSGNGMLTLSASNGYTGATTVNFGILLVNHAAALGNSTSVSVPNNGTSLTIGSGITTGVGKTVTIAGNGANSDGGLNVISGTGTWAGTVAMSGGRLGYNFGNLVVTGSVGGSSLTVSGYGGDTNTNLAGYAITLAGPTGYVGATSILRGWLKIGADNTLPVGTTLDVFTAPNNGAAVHASTFDLNGFNQTVAGLTSSGNNGKTGYANGYVTNTGASVKALTVNQATTGTYGGLITGNLAFTKSGAGNLTLMPIFVTGLGNAYVNGTNTFTGDTRVDGGTLTLSAAAGNASLALAGSTFDSDGAGTLSFGSMTAATFGGLKGAGNLILENTSIQAIALTVGANGGSTSYAGSLSGAGSLVKTGTGKLTLAGNNNYAGTTTVSSGILAVNGDQAAATGAVSIASLATLMGSGTIGGDTTIAGLHSPGNSPGIQTLTGDLTYSGGSSTVLWELAANTESNSPVAFDQIVVGGNLDFAGVTVLSLSFNGTGSTVNWSDAFWDSSRTWTLYSVSGTTTGLGNLALSGSPASWFDTQATPQSLSAARPDASFSIVQDGSNVNVVYAIVPEPGALVLAGIGIAAAAWSMRRKQV
ncbi:MAG: beta strand repeat-containing protein, partial [Planctomycetia bacterium]